MTILHGADIASWTEVYPFSTHQRVTRDPDSFEFFTEHSNEKGIGGSQWFLGPGPHGWPIFNFNGVCKYIEEAKAVDDLGRDLFEFPGLIDVQAALDCRLKNAFCQPHHAKSHREMVERYQDLRFRGAWRIFYVAPALVLTPGGVVEVHEALEQARLHEAAALEAGIVFAVIRGYDRPLYSDPELCGIDGPNTPFQLGHLASINPKFRRRYLDELTQHCCRTFLSTDAEEFQEWAEVFLKEDAGREQLIERGTPTPVQSKDYWHAKHYPEPPKKILYGGREHEHESRLLERGNRITEFLSSYVRADGSNPSAWSVYDGTFWKEYPTNDKVNALQEDFYVRNHWKSRDFKDLTSDRAALRRGVPNAIPTPSRRLLPFRNLCLDLETRECINHSPNNGNTYVLPIEYQAEQRDPKKIKAFLLDRLGSADLVEMYRAFIWHVLTGKSLKAFLEISGPAHTGKTVLTNLIVALIGQENTSSCSLEQLEDPRSRFETYRLKGKKLAVFSESQDYAGKAEMLKALSGQDRIRAEKKGSHAQCDFVFAGGIVIAGNSPVNFKDGSGAVINRRRSLIVDKVIDFKAERVMCEDDGNGNWRGELVDELSDMVNWVLDMDPADASRAMSRNLASDARRQVARQTLLSSNPLAEWANEFLVYDTDLQDSGKPMHSAQVGHLESNPGAHLLINYRSWFEKHHDGVPLTTKTFKRTLVEMLQTIGIPLPGGPLDKGLYRIDGKGSVVPFIRFRRCDDAPDHPGVIDAAFNLQTVDQRFPNVKTPETNGSNGSNGSEEVSGLREAETLEVQQLPSGEG